MARQSGGGGRRRYRPRSAAVRDASSGVDGECLRVLILSSSMGAGHDGAGRELIRRLEDEGHEVRMHDYLRALPLHIGWMIRRNYQLQLRYAPWSYENSYRLMPRIYGLLVFLNAFLARRRLDRWMTDFPPDVVVSNNPLATLAIGRLRQRRKLTVPTVTYITDFGVHPLWIHPGIDLHLAVHPHGAAEARRRSGGGRAEAPGPLVAPAFFAPPLHRRMARHALGLAPDVRAVLVVAGSWGVGEVEHTARMLWESGRFIPITVCGHDERLRRRLESAELGVVVGWTEDMAMLMSAADALVENAGGLTSLEALAARLPVVTYRPIPGHGRENAAAMEAAGVSHWALSPEELLEVLDRVTVPGPERDDLVAAGAAIFVGDAAAEVVELAEPGAALATLRRARRRRVGRRTATAAAAAVALYGTMTVGVAAAASYGLTSPDGGRPARQVVTAAGVLRPVAYVGVRVTLDELADPGVGGLIRRMAVTAVVTGHDAVAHPEVLRALSQSGVDVATGGWGRPRVSMLPEHVDVASAGAIGRLTGVHPSAYVPSRPVDALDLLWASRRHLAIVVPEHTITAGRMPVALGPGRSYIVDGRQTDAAQLIAMLAGVAGVAESQGMVVSGLQVFEGDRT